MIFTLIGMPGSGKSCMGRVLASKLKMKLIDSDKLIEKKMGKKLQVFIDELGVVAFRKIEEEVLLEIDSDCDAILSTGGSAVYSTKAMEYLKTKGKIIYLYCSYETIKERLGDFSKRGVVFKPGQDLMGLYLERTPMYEGFSDIIVNCDGRAYPKYQKDAIEKINACIKENE